MSIRQPWVELILRQDKRVENRTWSTTYRGPLLLHAPQKFDDMGVDAAMWAGITLPPQSSFPRGVIVGSAVLTDVHREYRRCCLPWGELSDESVVYHWMLDEVRRFDTPIPAAGRLGLWRVPDGVLEATDV